MRSLIAIFIFLAAASFGCGGATNISPNTGSAASGQQAANSPTPTPANVVNNSTPTASRPAPADEAEGDTADFAGTAGTMEKKNPGIKGVAILSDVRTAKHGNYDRMVFEFLGPDLPTYHIEYVDKPVRSCGSGDVVPLAGDGWLEVRFTDAQAHAQEGDATIKDRQRSPNLPVVKDLKLTCDFEAEVTWVAGVSSPNKYRVIELKNPTRLAVDIKR